MLNFEFQNPTKLIFGKGSIAKIAKQFSHPTKIMLTFGGGSVKRNGVYNQIFRPHLRTPRRSHNRARHTPTTHRPQRTIHQTLQYAKINNLQLLTVDG